MGEMLPGDLGTECSSLGSVLARSQSAASGRGGAQSVTVTLNKAETRGSEVSSKSSSAT